MDNTIRDDFADFVTDCELFNSTVKLYDSQGGTLKYEGNGIYDKKPDLVENEDGKVSYSGHKALLTLSKSLLVFMTSYFSLKGYYVEITDNDGAHNYWIAESSFTSNAGSIFCYLKETKIEV